MVLAVEVPDEVQDRRPDAHMNAQRSRHAAALAWLRWAGIVLGVLVVALVLTLAAIDWNRLRGPVSRQASKVTGHPVRILGDLDVQLLRRFPRVTVERVEVGNPAWAGGGNLATVRRATLELRGLDLLRGRLVFMRIAVDEPRLSLLRDRSGRANWSSGQPRRAASGNRAPDLPPVKRFVVRDGRLDYHDLKRGLTFQGLVMANEREGRDPARAFRFRGHGEMNGAPFDAELRGGPLVNVEPGRPYAFTATVRAGETQLDVQGEIPRPFDLGTFHATLRAAGPDLADLYYVSGLAFPNTPPYTLAGSLRREGARILIERLQGTVGGSDLDGELQVNLGGERPFLAANLVSTRLDLADLGPVFGGGPPQRDAARNPAPRTRSPADTGLLLPDARLQTERLHVMDAAVRFRAESVRARRLPLRDVAMRLALRDGVLTADPLTFTTPQGQVSGSVRLDARREVPVSTIDLRIGGVNLGTLFRRTGTQAGGSSPQEPPLAGVLRGRARFVGHGDSVHRVAASADGQVTLVLPHGQMRSTFAELLGINVARGLGLLLAKSQEQTELRCGLADFRVRSGVMAAQQVLVDTDHVLIDGSGTIDLRDETWHLQLRGHPKELRLVRLRAPVTVGGRLRKPEFGVQAGRLAGQAGIAGVLGAIATPFAAIAAFVDPGLAEDADCAALLQQAQRKGAPLPGQRTASAEGGGAGAQGDASAQGDAGARGRAGAQR